VTEMRPSVVALPRVIAGAAVAAPAVGPSATSNAIIASKRGGIVRMATNASKVFNVRCVESPVARSRPRFEVVSVGRADLDVVLRPRAIGSRRDRVAVALWRIGSPGFDPRCALTT
jgi:hypothetical protein